MKIIINDITLSSDFFSIPAQGSANIPIEIENLSEKYINFALVPCVGWLENGIVVSTTRAVTSVNEKKIFTLPAECFKNAGAIYISLGLIKNDEKVKTNEIVLFVGEAPDADVELPSDGTWETAVSSLVSSLFDERFENEINEILEDSKKLNNNTKTLQERINAAINYMGQYEWNGTKIRFKKGDGTWGVYKDIAGDFAKETEVAELKNAFNSVTSLTKQLFLLMHPVGSIYMSTSSTSPQTTFGGTWVEWGNGRVPVGVNTSDSDFNTVEKTGGVKDQDLRALIGAVENDSGSIGYYAEPPIRNMPRYVMRVNGTAMAQGNYSANHTTLVRKTDGNYASTIQPYITCYMWKRTA